MNDFSVYLFDRGFLN